METEIANTERNTETCKGAITAVKDALYVLNGKWKLPLILALNDGPLRFNEIQRALSDITPRVLSKELRELELNEFIERKVLKTNTITVTYQLLPYSRSLNKVLNELRDWGMQHREKIVSSRRRLPELAEAE